MKVTTPKFRVSFPAVFKARLNKLSGNEEYGVVALFEKGADLSKLKDAANAAMVKKWGEDKAKWPKNIRSPFRDQGDRVKDGQLPQGYEDGAIFLNLKSKQRPGVVDQSVSPILEQNEFYAGCYAIATVNAYAYDQAGNRGVSFGLGNLQKVGDGDPLGGRTTPDMDFKPVAVEATDSTSLFD